VLRYWLLIVRLLLLLALTTSAVLYVHYLNPADSGFCGGASGCEQVRHSSLAYFGSVYVSLPLFGILAFAGTFALSLAFAPNRTKLVQALLGANVLGASIAVALICYQLVVVGSLCWLCAIVDVAALLLAPATIALWQRTRTEDSKQVAALRPMAWATLGVLAVAGPLLWLFVRNTEVPGGVRQLRPPGPHPHAGIVLVFDARQSWDYLIGSKTS
jgi:uncharacterized membrane protein